MKRILKLVLIILQSILIFIIIGALTTATVKNVQKLILVENFKNKGVLQEDISTDKIKYYKVESEKEENSSYIIKDGYIYPGNKADIIVSVQSPLMPVISDIVTFFVGGHASICMGEYEDYEMKTTIYDSIEATGLEGGDNKSKVFKRNYWMNNNTYSEVIGLRVDLTEEERDEVVSVAASLLGDPYNFSFLFDTKNKTYCSDLISKIYGKIGYDLNKDDFVTCIYDIIVSDETYISYYHNYDSDGVLHLYYLG